MMHIALLTGGQDKHYSHGLAAALAQNGVAVDFIGSDELDAPELRAIDSIRFLNLRGDQSAGVGARQKLLRVVHYYWRLIRYAAAARPAVFHILWNNRIEWFDRTLLMLWYRLCRRRVVLTAHNVNTAKRDGYDSAANRLTLRMQYGLCDRIFVHTNRMKQELVGDLSVRADKIVVIPYGINDVVQHSSLTSAAAKSACGIAASEKTMLCFGNIGPYKGIDYLVEAFEQLVAGDPSYKLIIAGKPKRAADRYWEALRERLRPLVAQGRAVLDIRHVPDDITERYFKAADVLVMPYREIFQSGVLFCGYSYGLPVVATDVGSFRDDVVDGVTGFICQPHDAASLATAVRTYFQSDLYAQLDQRRAHIRAHAAANHCWDTVASLTTAVYGELDQRRSVPAVSASNRTQRNSDSTA
jgi:glycosyltransferase involved in cell wall biosynthesis